MNPRLASSDSNRLEQANHQARHTPGHHAETPEYDDLFMASFTPSRTALHAVQGDEELADEATESALTAIGTSWRYIVRTPRFVRALAMIFYLRAKAHEEHESRCAALAAERRQGRSLSSSHDVVVAPGPWLIAFLDVLPEPNRRIVEFVLRPLTLLDAAQLLEENTLRVARRTAWLWDAAGAPDEAIDNRKENP